MRRGFALALLAAVTACVVVSCTNDYNYTFGDAGTSAVGGAANGGGGSSAGGTGGGGGCANGAVACASGCTDVRTDPANCGGCGIACPSGFSCALGRCRCSGSGSCGPGGNVQCNNFGRCRCDGQTCGTGEVCNGNGCSCNGGPSCPDGQTCCPSGCANHC